MARVDLSVEWKPVHLQTTLAKGASALVDPDHAELKEIGVEGWPKYLERVSELYLQPRDEFQSSFLLHTSEMLDVDTLVVGAGTLYFLLQVWVVLPDRLDLLTKRRAIGPVGLFTAILLVKFGFKIRIIDQNPEPIGNGGDSCYLNSRTLEILHSIDPALAQEVLLAATTDAHTYWYKNGALIMETRFLELDCRFTYPTYLQKSQYITILTAYLTYQGVHIDRSTRLVDFEARFEGDGVSAIIEDLETGVTSTVEVAYLIGADGIKSVTRMRLGIPIKDICPPMPWYMVDATIGHSTLPTIGKRNCIENKNGMVYHAATGGGFYRFSLRIYSDITEDLSQEEVIERIKLVVLPFEIEFKTVDLFSRYNLNHFVAEEFSQDRVFLVGIGVEYHISSLNLYASDDIDLRVRPGMRSPDGRITPSMITDGVTPTRLLDLFTAVPIFHILVFMGDPSHNNDYLEKLADLVTLQRLSPFTPNRRKFVEYKEIYELIIIVPANVSQPSCTSIVEAAGGIYYTDDVTEDEGLYARL
ncbi:FAD binding domain-containing protein [Jimgerdemannia flammicorona]|uniref:FAD binding domain-containing protein n=1 Tax=Jimgerdemannia flammicorona TaxID=994334 RepID=A0A433QGI7_9FUNG|nr:FAD binding domain-containing protein [Jimgerdemannia flammicorona]